MNLCRKGEEWDRKRVFFPPSPHKYRQTRTDCNPTSFVNACEKCTYVQYLRSTHRTQTISPICGYISYCRLEIGADDDRHFLSHFRFGRPCPILLHHTLRYVRPTFTLIYVIHTLIMPHTWGPPPFLHAYGGGVPASHLPPITTTYISKDTTHVQQSQKWKRKLIHNL